tara:strand:+ start:56 stop:484 length:429 start_codon:yes stop_codon:yes gene_type:complete
MLDLKFFIKLAKDVVPMFRKHTFIKGLDINGRKFKKYSTKYNQLKKSGKLFRQATEFAQSNAPVLTSDLLRDWKLQGTSSSGFKFGTLTQGGKVDNLAKMGRVISTDRNPMPDKIEKFILNEADKYVKKELKKIKGGTFNIG